MRHQPACLWTHHECTVELVLYNRGDWVDIQLLVDRGIPDATVDVEARSSLCARLDNEMGMDDDSPVLVESVIAGQTRSGKRINVTDKVTYWPASIYAATFGAAIAGVLVALLTS